MIAVISVPLAIPVDLLIVSFFGYLPLSDHFGGQVRVVVLYGVAETEGELECLLLQLIVLLLMNKLMAVSNGMR